MEIKKGDIVRVPTDIPQFYLRYNSMRIFEQTFSVVDIEGGLALLGSTTTPYKAVIPCKYLIKVDAEAEEDARVRQMEAELDKFRKAELDRVLYPEKSHTYEVTVDNVAMDWQRYEADLAKEIALKVANRYNDPEETAKYAAKAAKQIVKHLKENK